MGPYVQGYRILTDEYVVVSDRQGLWGQDGFTQRGPGMVQQVVVLSFKPIAEAAEIAVRCKQEMVFRGEIVLKNDGMPLLFAGRKVLLLYEVEYAGRCYRVER